MQGCHRVSSIVRHLSLRDIKKVICGSTSIMGVIYRPNEVVSLKICKVSFLKEVLTNRAYL